ncbi:hypothetical protein GCM10027592_29000 [Spirosoma flavus]
MSLTKRIVVDLSHQTLTAYTSGHPTYTFHCATGDSSNPTPPGPAFRIYRKERYHISSQFHVPMHHALFFNHGIAIHEAQMVGLVSYLKVGGADFFGSHGCVRLSVPDATTLFDWAEIGTQVEVKS